MVVVVGGGWWWLVVVGGGWWWYGGCCSVCVPVCAPVYSPVHLFTSSPLHLFTCSRDLTISHYSSPPPTIPTLSHQVPLRLMPLFTWQEAEVLVCGSPEINLDDLKHHTAYQGYSGEQDVTIKHFWTVMEEWGHKERYVKYL
jgi:hypothetical protein